MCYSVLHRLANYTSFIFAVMGDALKQQKPTLSNVSVRTDSCLQLYIFKKCLCPLPLMSNGFSDYYWLFQGGASLLALDDTHLLQVFIFTSWSSPPVTTRAGWAAREADALLQGLPTAWFMIALSAMANRERHLFVSLGTTLCNVLDVCHQLAQAAAC